LKKYAVGGFLTVFLFQGAFTYLMCSSAFGNGSIELNFSLQQLLCMSIASFFIGSVYPLTQIYQHNADKKDGVTTISYRLGYDGTFFFSAAMFTVAVSLLFYYFSLKAQMTAFFLFNLIMIPVVVRLAIWFLKVRKDKSNANFENTMSMNLFASGFMNLYFTVLILNKFFIWF
jgi:1,4-dihydroxy-2-naphthoate octaprenyltransferase